MKFTNKYISDMTSCAKSKLAAASLVARNREYLGMYGLTDSIWHVHQLVLYLFLIQRWDNTLSATNASTEEDLSHMFDRIIRMPYPCDLVAEVLPITTVNLPPVVDAGPDRSLNSLATSVTLPGLVTDPDGDSFTVLWTKISGGNATINSPTSIITSITNMQQGTYVFQLTATDSKGASASDTVTVTIASAVNNVYFGRSNNPFPVSNQEAYILSGTSTQVNALNDVYIPWYIGATNPEYCWVAIPNIGTASQKNQWYVDIVNQGNMGSPSDLFGAPITVSVNGADYWVWDSNYKTQFSKICALKKS
jgi:hypothetical protein